MGKLFESIGSLFAPKAPKAMALPPPPPPPTPTEPLKAARDRNMQASDEIRRKAALMGAKATNPTGALGLPGAAPTSKKTLLGQ